MSYGDDAFNKAADLRLRATEFGEITYGTATTATVIRGLPPGLYEVAAYDAEAYVLSGEHAALTTTKCTRIDPGQRWIWWVEKNETALTYQCASGGQLRITPRRRG